MGHPQLDLTGRSTYNSITSGWMEHSYAASYAPLTTLRLGADYSHINFKDYLASVTKLVRKDYDNDDKE